MQCRFCGIPITYSWEHGDYVHNTDADQICDLPKNHPLFMIAIATPEED